MTTNDVRTELAVAMANETCKRIIDWAEFNLPDSFRLSLIQRVEDQHIEVKITRHRYGKLTYVYLIFTASTDWQTVDDGIKGGLARLLASR